MTTPRPTPKPPSPPANDAIRFSWKDTHLVVATPGWETKIPIPGATIHTIDNTGKRITVTRLATIGIFALAAKKKSGSVSIIVAGADGETATAKVKPKHAEKVMVWAVAFNAWSEANPPTA